MCVCVLFVCVPVCVVSVCVCVCSRWLVLDTDTRDLVSMHTDGNEVISNVKYSPGTVVY